MRVLLARVSILSVCVLAVSAAPARGQSPTLTSVRRQDSGATAPTNSCRRASASATRQMLAIYDASDSARCASTASREMQYVAIRNGVKESGQNKFGATGADRLSTRESHRSSDRRPSRTTAASHAAQRQSSAGAGAAADSDAGAAEHSQNVPSADQTAGSESATQGSIFKVETFRGGQAGRLLQRGASPGARCSVFSGSEVCRRIFESHHRY